MKQFIFFLTLFFSVNVSAQQSDAAPNDAPVTLEPVSKPAVAPKTLQLGEGSFFNNTVSVPIPNTFKTAPAEFIEMQYPDAASRPKVILVDPTQSAILGLNITEGQNEGQSIIKFFRDIKNDIRARYKGYRFLKSDVIRNHTLGVVEVIIPNRDGQMMYNLMAFRYIDDKFFFFNFSCPEEDMPEWQDMANEMAESIKVIKAPR